METCGSQKRKSRHLSSCPRGLNQAHLLLHSEGTQKKWERNVKKAASLIAQVPVCSQWAPDRAFGDATK